MFLISGFKQFNLHRYSYKWMQCRRCQQPQVFEQWRWSAWMHLFYIPLIPVGYQYEWRCTACGSKAASDQETGLITKFLLLVLALWLEYILAFEYQSVEVLASWQPALRWSAVVVVLLTITWLGYAIVYHRKRKTQRRYKGMLPLRNLTECALCDGELTIKKASILQCRGCQCIAQYPPDDISQP